MHEMSLAVNIIELAEQAAREANARSISRIEIVVGELAGVSMEALEFSLSVATHETMAQSAKLNMEVISGSARCNGCGQTFHLPQLWAVCPHCNDFSYEILTGKELKIKTIDIE